MTSSTHRLSFLNRSPLGVNKTLIPPDRVSPAAIALGRSARAAPSFSMISMAACNRPITMMRVMPCLSEKMGPYSCVHSSNFRYPLCTREILGQYSSEMKTYNAVGHEFPKMDSAGGPGGNGKPLACDDRRRRKKRHRQKVTTAMVSGLGVSSIVDQGKLLDGGCGESLSRELMIRFR